MKKRLRSPAVLLVAFAMVIATAGVVYAHWTSTSRIEGNISTGNIGMGWENVSTNDDGLDNDPSGNDWNLPFDDTEPYDSETVLYDGTHTSKDPKNGDDPGDRYFKDVAICTADGGGGGDMINVNIENAYPSYICHLYADAFNFGSVPVKAAALTLTAQKGHHECTAHLTEADGQSGANPVPTGEGEHGTFIDLGNDGVFDVGTDGWMSGDIVGPFAEVDGVEGYSGTDFRFWDYCDWIPSGMAVNAVPGVEGEFLFGNKIRFHIEEGILCGTQIDPNAGIGTMGWLHVEQPTEQDSQYRFALTQEWVNWNEWDPSMCTLNGVPIPLP